MLSPDLQCSSPARRSGRQTAAVLHLAPSRQQGWCEEASQEAPSSHRLFFQPLHTPIVLRTRSRAPCKTTFLGCAPRRGGNVGEPPVLAIGPAADRSRAAELPLGPESPRSGPAAPPLPQACRATPQPCDRLRSTDHALPGENRWRPGGARSLCPSRQAPLSSAASMLPSGTQRLGRLARWPEGCRGWLASRLWRPGAWPSPRLLALFPPVPALPITLPPRRDPPALHKRACTHQTRFHRSPRLSELCCTKARHQACTSLRAKIAPKWTTTCPSRRRRRRHPPYQPTCVAGGWALLLGCVVKQSLAS